MYLIVSFNFFPEIEIPRINVEIDELKRVKLKDLWISFNPVERLSLKIHVSRCFFRIE